MLALVSVYCWLGHIGVSRAMRVALLVGNDEGQGADARLRYAESDATRLATLLTRVGGFAPDGIVVQLGRTAGEVELRLADLTARLRASRGDHLVVLYYRATPTPRTCTWAALLSR